MRKAALRLIAAVLGVAAVALASGGRVLLVSLDGFGYQIWVEDRVAEELKTLRRVAAGGVTARGVMSSFPSLTAPAHASLWTGAYGDVNGVTANDNPVLPRNGHSFTERRNGFRSESLLAEPLWVAAARQGVRVVAHQPPQAYPFGDRNTAPGAVVVNCYQTETLASGRVLRAAGAAPEPAEAWKPLRPGRAFHWETGSLTLHAALAGGVLHVAADPRRGPRVIVRPAPAESEPPRRRPLARHFSAGLPVTVNGEPGVVYFRLFELRPDGSDFLLYQSPLKQTGIHGAPARDRDVLLAEAGGMVGNGAHRAYVSGALGKAGGGIAKERYLETLELSVRQFNRYSEWLWARYRPRLLIDYASIPDEFEHAWLGHLRFRGAMDEWRRWGFVIVERRLAALEALAEAGDSFLVASDHGMGAFDREVRVNTALERAGLNHKAVLAGSSILINTADWRGRVVPLGQRAEVVEQARAALEALRDPESGRAVFTAFFRPGEAGAPPGLGGPAGGDLYFDLAPGYRASSAPGGEILARLAEPVGAHGLDPARNDMLAVLFARGPGLPPGGVWPRLRTIDIAPLVADLLGIEPPAQARGQSPLSKR